MEQKLITQTVDKDGNSYWWLNNEPFEPTELEKANYYFHLYDYAHIAFIEAFSDITTHPDFVWPDLKLREKILAKGEQYCLFLKAAEDGLCEVYPFEKHTESEVKSGLDKSKPVQSSLDKLMNKLFCRHRWEILFRADYGSEGKLTGAKITYRCLKCGKLKNIKY